MPAAPDPGDRVRAEILDPRTDPEPDYWPRLRATAGLRADWDWRVLAAQAWGARTIQLITVLFDGDAPVAVVNAAWLGAPVHRFSFNAAGSRPWLGAVHVRGPGSGAVPGWWLADGVPLSVLTDAYARAMRRELGAGCLALVLRQVTAEQAATVRSRKLVRVTEPVWRLPTHRWADKEQWLMSLTRSRRSNLRGILRKVAENEDLEVRSHRATEEIDEVRVIEAMRWNDDKYAGGIAPRIRVLNEYMRALMRQPDVYSYTYTERSTGQLIAFGMVFDHPTTPIVRSWTQRPAAEGGAKFLYFYHLAKQVEWAVGHGREWVELGKGKSAEKKSLGAEPSEQLAMAVPIRPW
ncbi:GNAT family N-acetyltransferase [Actinokineospora enzanensis]|uniref:GNAT family N-acetyltransferase n=1 Tax=Actinokineospora enzanensis TaxID=155975 RepID=UPI000367C967|nr:GNAT family N-acetyltransferase [Actinokineospora enzanensis]